MNGFSLNGKNSRDYGIIMTAPPNVVLSARKVETVTIPGRSGTLTMDSHSYENIPIQYKCAIVPEDPVTLREAAEKAMEILESTAEYKRLENTYTPAYFQMARVSSQISIESIVEQAGTFSIPFDMMPQRYLKAGEFPISMEAAGILLNPTLFPAKPLITVYGSGAGTVSVGTVNMAIKSNDGHIVFDCDMQDAYHVADSGALESRNSCINVPEFPVLPAGETVISWTGAITSVEIIPRWWTL